MLICLYDEEKRGNRTGQLRENCSIGDDNTIKREVRTVNQSTAHQSRVREPLGRS